MAATENCANCNVALPLSDSVRLWDGKDYCRSCVEAQLPGLAAHVASQQRLEDSAPQEVVDDFKRPILTYILFGLLFGIPFGIVGHLESGPLGLRTGFFFAMGISACAAAIQIPGFIWTARRYAPTVSVENGVVTVKRKAYGEHRYPLGSVQWSLGKSKRDSMLRYTMIKKVDVVLLEVPTRFLGFTVVVRVACGWSEDMRSRWIAFLTLANFTRSK